VPVILLATIVEGFGTGLAGPVALNTALRAVLPTDTGAAGAGTSATGQLGSSIGAALLNTIAATATASYLAAHATTTVAAATVHGVTVAMICGTAILLIAAIPITILINAKTPTTNG
jgi:hypothetical protein